MAITIEQQPSEPTAVYNHCTYTVSSTNYANTNFRFVCDIYINGDLIKREKRSPHPTYNVGYFDVGRIIESYLTHDINLADTDGWNSDPNSFLEAVVSFGEEYGATSTGTTVYPNDSSGTYRFFNGAIKPLDWLDVTTSDYYLTANTKKFLTNKPRTFNIFLNQYDWLYGMSIADTSGWYYEVETFDSAGATIDTFQISSSITANHFRIATGYNMNDIPAGQFTLGTPPVITDSVASYTVFAHNGVKAVSETFTFNVIDDCGLWDTNEVHFLNALGGFDSYQFRRKSVENTTIEKREYKKNVGTFSASGIAFSKSDRGYQSYFTSSNDTITLTSGYITESEYAWLTELIQSSQVFINNNGALVAVTVVDTSYELKRTINDNLINLTITLKYAQSNYRQRY